MHCFSFLCWVKVCSGRFRQVLFPFGRQKKLARSVRQVVVLYKNDCMRSGLGGLKLATLDEGPSYRGGHLSRFDCDVF